MAALQVQWKQRKKVFYARKTAVLQVQTCLPQVCGLSGDVVQTKINCDIQETAVGFWKKASGSWYQQAAQACQDAKDQQIPFFPHEAALVYTISLNRYGFFSTFHDCYTFTGGAHGSTLRASDTWSLSSGAKVPLAAWFPEGQDIRLSITQKILEQADQQMQQQPGIYFEDYRERIVQNFEEKNYYLTPTGMAFYYQQYEIAPYSTGIVVFVIPYQELGISLQNPKSVLQDGKA